MQNLFLFINAGMNGLRVITLNLAKNGEIVILQREFGEEY
jgi:hypothetical protein